jgi:hypothetical protein
MSAGLIAVCLGVVTTLGAVWAAIFATRADMATRLSIQRADARWEATTRPVPHITFAGPPAPGQAIDLNVENLGGTLAAGGLIVQGGDDIYAGELAMAEKAPARRMTFPPVVKAWQRTSQPKVLLLVARDAGGKCWDCLDGGRQIKDPRKWLADHLRELRMQGIVEFPGVTGPSKR